MTYLVPSNVSNTLQGTTIPRIIYSDLTLFETENKDLVLNADTVQQNIMYIASVTRGSRWWRFNFGSNVARYLFDPMDEVTAGKIRTDLQLSITEWIEQRIVLNSIEVVPDYENQTYYVEISYDAPELRRYGIVFSFGLAQNT